ncbi:flavin-containing monooxygenase [Paraburkholderia phytofirmans]|uniref:flavin-containing monooxygenase n=1 Tax=Paraburkholderia phytofirmans TaxID=261302 RepID=UPI0038B86D33
MVDRSSASPHGKDVSDHHFDVVVVGAGFAGMYMLHRLRNMGMSVRAYEAAPTVGGTWYWNRYPGARCDAESVEYSYAFNDELQQDWTWTERFATQPEILRYAEHVAERFDLKRDIVFETRVKRALFDESNSTWRIETDRGDPVEATFFVMATGPLSAARVPDFPGLDGFGGRWYHTSNWPTEPVDFTGKRVGVIGTGSTGIQCIPVIAQQAKQLHVFQRTANFSVPARNAPLSADYVQSVKDRYSEIRELARWRGLGLHERGNKSAFDVSDSERAQIYEHHWQNGGPTFMHAFADLITNKEANNTAVKFVHGKIREIVKDTRTAELLMPKDHPLGAKRICVDTDYYATFNRENVELVDVRSAPIETILPSGLKTWQGSYELDIIVFATGFDALTGSITKVDIEGVGGKRLKDNWGAGPVNYLSFGVADFPNMFMIAGPGSPGVLANVVMVIEQHVEWISAMLEHMRENGYSRVEIDPASEAAWVQHVNDVAAKTLLLQANSWYLGANVPGKPRVFMPYAGGIGAFRQKCLDVASNGYSGFLFKA